MRLRGKMYEKVLYQEAKAYFSGYGGLLIKDFVEHDGETYVLFTSDGFTQENQKAHSRVLYFVAETSRTYFVWNGARIYLDECVRCQR